MSVFHMSDRAFCMDPGNSALTMGRLYYVNACVMHANGTQTLNLLGMGRDDWYNASRFVRVADVTPRKWPAQ